MTHIHTGAASLRSIDLRGPAGKLEALLNEGIASPRFATLVCHPHPLGGGTLHNKVVYHVMKVLQGFGYPVLRFNFRGTGLSEGIHDDGHGEQDDVRAALDWLEQTYHLPILVAGFSFGAVVSLKATCQDPRIVGLAALGLPILADGRSYEYPFLPSCTLPKLFLSGDQDPYGPVADVERVVATAPAPCKLVWIPGADHFFAGKLDLMQAALRTWIEEMFL